MWYKAVWKGLWFKYLSWLEDSKFEFNYYMLLLMRRYRKWELEKYHLNQISFLLQDVGAKRPINNIDVNINLSISCSLWADALNYGIFCHVQISLLLESKSKILFQTVWYVNPYYYCCTIRRYVILHTETLWSHIVDLHQWVSKNNLSKVS